MDCGKDTNAAFCKRHLVNHYPDLRLYPIREEQSQNPPYVEFAGFDTRAASLAAWASSHIGTVYPLEENDDWRQVTGNR